MNRKKQEYIKEEFDKLAAVLDKRYEYFKLLQDFNDKHGCVPEEHQKAWEDFQIKDAGLLWRDHKNAYDVVYKAAKIHAERRIKNERNNRNH